ncbi:low molecular weight phosphatase family protein [Chelativorans sp. AA-79]|uniref:arsenate-mycothiol transferase ArsC n=1 Tax=Chelativorans sp. AA-79 TaxID=3028735 RepID=UPI0023F96B8E|nr:low molecular weight phosphatase family protein [Chelativorans sp. AA-79]WEX08800.1 low molecular weight phosphatase family protein [Chelativorans sp. AA-79]
MTPQPTERTPTQTTSARALPRSVLFLCGQNSIRSPMAEALAKRILPRSVFISSAGVRIGPRDPFVDAILLEEKLSLGNWSPRRMEDLEDSYFDLIITLAPEAHHAALELTRTMPIEVEYWPTLDPSVVEGTRDQIMSAYREVRDALAAQITKRFRTGRFADET